MNQRGVDPKMLRNKRFALKVRAASGRRCARPRRASTLRARRAPAHTDAPPPRRRLNPQGTRKSGQRVKAYESAEYKVAQEKKKKAKVTKKVQA